MNKPGFYLFLDADGVLHPVDLLVRGMTREEMRELAMRSPLEAQLAAHERGFVNASDEPALSRLPLLEQTIRPHLEHIEIIISSSWRFDENALHELLSAMSDDVRARVVGVTPPRARMGDCRPDEIRMWLEEHGKPGVLAIVLDDGSPRGNRTNFEVLGKWIQMDSRRAFGAGEAAELASLLTEKAR